MIDLYSQYVAFPLLFTTAFFSMSFVNPPYPWAVFVGVLIVVGLVNYIIASLLSSKKTRQGAAKMVRRRVADFRLRLGRLVASLQR